MEKTGKADIGLMRNLLWLANGRMTMQSSEQTRADLLVALAELSRIRPDWRLGQTFANLVMTAVRLDAGGVWDLEDEEALEAAKTLLDQHSQAQQTVAQNLVAALG